MINMILSIGSALILILIICPFLFWGRQILKNIKAMPRLAQLLLLLILAWQVFQLALHFPGLISSDDVFLWEALEREGLPWVWQSMTYSFVTYGWAGIIGSPYYLSLLNFVFFAFLLFLVLRVLPSTVSRWTLLGLAIVFAMPQSSALVLFQNRDSLNSLLLLWLFIGFLAQATPAKQDPWFQPWVLMTLSLVLGDLRQEGRFLVILTPLALWWGQSKPFSILVKHVVLVTVAAITLYGYSSKILSADPYSPIYKSTLLLNPLGQIFYVRGAEAATPEEIQKIEKLVLISDLIENYHSLDIDVFHRGKVKFLSQEEFKEVESAIFSVFIKNWDLVLKNRLFIISTMLNFQGYPYMFSSKFPPPSQLAIEHLQKMRTVAYGLLRSFHYSMSSFLMPLVTLLFGLSYFKARPEIFSASATNLLRLAIVTVAAPAPYFKYISSSWVFGWILFFYLLEEYKKSRLTNLSV